MTKPGTKMGCNDTAPPQHATAQQLSRIKDLMDLAKAVSTVTNIDFTKAIWDAVPYNVKVDSNYANWQYEAPLA